MIEELCPCCAMPKRNEKTIIQNESMIFYHCGTTEILKIENSQFSGLTQTRNIYRQSEPCKEIVRLRAEIKLMNQNKTDA